MADEIKPKYVHGPHPVIDGAPGVVWRQRTQGRWSAIWQASTRMVGLGFTPKSYKLWSGIEPSEMEKHWIIDSSNRLQNKMHLFAAGLRAPTQTVAGPFSGTIRSLIACYQTDKDSRYQKLRYGTRLNHDRLLKRIIIEHGDVDLAEIKARTLLRWHEEWAGIDSGHAKIATAHSLIAQLRSLFSFGATLLESEECERLCGVLHKMKFQMSRPRQEALTAEQANLIRAEAHRRGWHSIALAQAFQFECILRQKDVIGEWVPLDEPGISDIEYQGRKWIMGIQGREIDDNLILRHVTSKKGKKIEHDLKLAPMVMEEFARLPMGRPGLGPVIISESTQRPFGADTYRKTWRMIARAVGVPDSVFNMDSRAGGITEATDGGASLELTRHAATHSNVSTTAGYSRGTVEKTAEVMRIRVKHRANKPGTE